MARAREALQRLPSETWLILQGTLAATAAWMIAKYALDHPEPFFAPVAAVIALNTVRGERGRNAVRLLQGVIVGIAVGEIVLLLLGPGAGSLALATFVAMALAHAVGGTRIVIAQAAVGGILTVALGSPDAGFDRMLDALIGVGVALLFTQVLFSPQPLALLRRAESAALADMAEGLRLTARALEYDDEDVGERAMSHLRTLRDRLSELGRTRAASARAARRSAVWRSQIAPVVRETEDAGRLDLLGGSCLTLTRSALATDQACQRGLAPRVRELADALAELGGDPGDRATRQAAADRALDVARQLAAGEAPTDPEAVAAIVGLRTVASDLMVFAGVDAEEADAAVREGTGQFQVPAPPSPPRAPFGLRRPTR
jgi:Fusaric acid resistance protein-like